MGAAGAFGLGAALFAGISDYWILRRYEGINRRALAAAASASLLVTVPAALLAGGGFAPGDVAVVAAAGALQALGVLLLWRGLAVEGAVSTGPACAVASVVSGAAAGAWLQGAPGATVAAGVAAGLVGTALAGYRPGARMAGAPWGLAAGATFGVMGAIIFLGSPGLWTWVGARLITASVLLAAARRRGGRGPAEEGVPALWPAAVAGLGWGAATTLWAAGIRYDLAVTNTLFNLSLFATLALRLAVRAETATARTAAGVALAAACVVLVSTG